MTPQKRANQLIEIFDNAMEYTKPKRYAKQCALIAVQLIINSNPHSNPFNTDVYPVMGYWIEVKEEIEKL